MGKIVIAIERFTTALFSSSNNIKYYNFIIE